MRSLLIALGLVWTVIPSTSVSQARSEVPVREVVLSDGARRYGVPITVGATSIEAGLDTGSSGLRILPGVLNAADARPNAHRDTYSYGSGAKLDGVIGRAAVTVGTVSGETTVQLIREVGCFPTLPRCAAGRIALKDYGIQGDGLPGEGFKAILGVNMGDAPAASLFKAIGARRWIIELPRPGEGGMGRIILNPTDEEVAGFARLHPISQFDRQQGGLHDSVPGCLQNMVTRQNLCGAVLMDTGAPGITVEVANTGPIWQPDTPAALALIEKDKPVAVATFRVDRRAQASKLTFRDGHDGEGNGPGAIYAGLLPFFAWSVLYDPAAGVIGVRPRPPGPEGLQGALAP